MKIRFNNLRYFMLGSLMLAPFSFFFLNTQIFYAQTLIIIISLGYFLAINKKLPIRLGTHLTLDTLFYLYLLWLLVSFILNFAFGFGDFELQGRRVYSLIMAILLLSGFFVGKLFRATENNMNNVMNGIFFTYSIVILYFTVIFITQFRVDLYIIRRVIGQRLPFVIAFVSTLAASYFFLRVKRNSFQLLFALSGLLVVIFSLTRAAYIQVFISFLIIFIGQIKKFFFRGILLVSILSFALFVLIKVFDDSPAVRQVASRIELLFDVQAQSKEDISGSFRVHMWKFLYEKLLDDPIRLIIGYGQLGPSYITRDFILPDGSSGTSSAHNQYLDILVREGLIGLFLFLFLCYRVFWLGFANTIAPTPESRTFFLANSIGLLGVMFYSFFHETFRYPLFGFYFWFYIGILSQFTVKTNVYENYSESYKGT